MPRTQRVLGVEFSYQPPPKITVPFAASLKGTHIGSGGGSGSANGSGRERCAGVD